MRTINAIYAIVLIIGALNILFGDGILGFLIFMIPIISLYKGVVFCEECDDPHVLVYGRRLQ